MMIDLLVALGFGFGISCGFNWCGVGNLWELSVTLVCNKIGCGWHFVGLDDEGVGYTLHDCLHVGYMSTEVA